MEASIMVPMLVAPSLQNWHSPQIICSGDVLNATKALPVPLDLDRNAHCGRREWGCPALPFDL